MDTSYMLLASVGFSLFQFQKSTLTFQLFKSPKKSPKMGRNCQSFYFQKMFQTLQYKTINMCNVFIHFCYRKKYHILKFWMTEKSVFQMRLLRNRSLCFGQATKKNSERRCNQSTFVFCSNFAANCGSVRRRRGGATIAVALLLSYAIL